MGIESAQQRPEFDPLITAIADYVVQDQPANSTAYDTARWCLKDSLGCALLALRNPDCAKMISPVVPGAELINGTPIPGTSYKLDPVMAAFNIGAMIRWLDYNDTWLACEWGHPSDNLGAILACADYMSRSHQDQTRQFSVRDVLQAMIKAYEIQGVLALDHAFNKVGLDHVLLVRIASTAVATELLGGSRGQICNAISNAWVDGGALRTYRHAPNTGTRKSWAAGDATSRGVRLALLARAGEMGYPSALSAKTWGFSDVLFGGNPIRLSRPLGSYVMENILFKLMPAEFHAQTAAEAAIRLHQAVRDRLDQVSLIQIETQESAIRIINKTGPLYNRADRDHCLQYIVAVALIHGMVRPECYDSAFASDPTIDLLRGKMQVCEEPKFSRDYLDPEKRSIANAIQITFADGTRTERIEVHYPIGHRQRRDEAIPLLQMKWKDSLSTQLTDRQCQQLVQLSDVVFDALPVHHLLDLLRLEK